jgi:hypothetical protein
MILRNHFFIFFHIINMFSKYEQNNKQVSTIKNCKLKNFFFENGLKSSLWDFFEAILFKNHLFRNSMQNISFIEFFHDFICIDL